MRDGKGEEVADKEDSKYYAGRGREGSVLSREQRQGRCGVGQTKQSG